MLDFDLAKIYGVTTKRLNEQIKRNAGRFPSDFAFRLKPGEAKILESQTYVLSDPDNRSQFATGSQRHRDPRIPPWVFTEHGAIMAAMVLNSPRAVQMSVFVVRAFVCMREQLLERAELGKRLADIEKTLMAHNGALRDLYRKIRPLLLPPPPPPLKPIGFSVKEVRTIYRARRKRYIK